MNSDRKVNRGLKNSKELKLVKTSPDHEQKVKIIEEILSQVKSTVSGEISFGNILEICLNCMKLVEMYAFPGDEKKEIVMAVLSKLLEENHADLGILSVIPQYIDSIINVDKGNISIHITAEDVEQAVSCCVRLCKAAK